MELIQVSEIFLDYEWIKSIYLTKIRLNIAR